MEVLSVNRIGNRIERHIDTISSSHISGTGLSFDRFMTSALHAMNYSVYEYPRARQRLTSVLWYQAFPILLCALISGAFIALPTHPLLTLLFGVFTLTAVAMGLGWDKIVEWFSSTRAHPGSPYRTLVAMHPMQDKPYTVVFTASYAHYGRLFSRKTAARLLGGIAVFAVIAASLLVTDVFTGLSRFWALPPFALAYALTIVLQFNKLATSERIRKANASSPAVLLELANAFSGASPNANLVFITGETPERGVCGAAAVLDDPEFAMTFPPERTSIVHLEGSGTGRRIALTDRYGFPPVKTGILFSKLAKDVCEKFGLECVNRWRLSGVDTPPAQTHQRGYPSIGIATARGKRVPHSAKEHAASHEYLFAVAQEIVDSIPRIRPPQTM